MTTPKLIAVVGPTGSGKTALATALAKQFNGVLVSADSRQVYRGLDVGTNKEGELGRWRLEPARFINTTPQLAIDIAAPGDRFTMNDWLLTARRLLTEIWAAGQLPIIVGGTGLYVSALLDGYQPGGGRHAKTQQLVDFQSLTLQTAVPRAILYQKSDQRVDRNFAALVAETKVLLRAGVSSVWLDGIGLDYRFASRFINGKLSHQEAVRGLQQASRAYIRRQLTWWRHHGQPIKVSDLAAAVDQATCFLDDEEYKLHFLCDACANSQTYEDRLVAFKTYLDIIIKTDSTRSLTLTANKEPHLDSAYRLVNGLAFWDYWQDYYEKPSLRKPEIFLVDEIFELAGSLETILPTASEREQKWRQLKKLADQLAVKS